jgi:hypothetical protein
MIKTGASSRRVVRSPFHTDAWAKEIGLIIIGIDPHQRVHTASAVDATTNRRLASVEIDASLAGYGD